eukprot:3057461-Rhodomonas_salina.3
MVLVDNGRIAPGSTAGARGQYRRKAYGARRAVQRSRYPVFLLVTLLPSALTFAILRSRSAIGPSCCPCTTYT